MVAAGTLPRALVLLVGGVVADRHEARWVMLVCNLVRIGVLVGTAVWVLVGGTTVPLLLAIRAPGAEHTQRHNMLRELREGWSAFASRKWLWVTTIQYGVVLAAWYGAFDVLGPVVAKRHLGGPAAWGLIVAADAVGLRRVGRERVLRVAAP